MQLAIVEGTVISHHKHRSMDGWKLLIVQMLGIDGKPDGEPIITVDFLGATHGDIVLMSSDGRGTRELLGDKTTPVRWSVAGIADQIRCEGFIKP